MTLCQAIAAIEKALATQPPESNAQKWLDHHDQYLLHLMRNVVPGVLRSHRRMGDALKVCKAYAAELNTWHAVVNYPEQPPITLGQMVDSVLAALDRPIKESEK